MDTESINTDTEGASPETNYFKMMMQENLSGRVNDNTDGDSILGGQTLASVMDNDMNATGGAGDAQTIDSYSVANNDTVQQHPNETLSIVGVEEDDVSTIANDTVNETTKTFFTGQGSRQDSKPRIRLFKEYITPEKKKKTRAHGASASGENIADDDDDQTAPETPPGMIRVPAGNRSTSTSSNNRKEEGAPNGGKISFIRSRRVFIVAGVLALILFVSIIALSAALKGMRDSGTSSSAMIDSENGNNILDLWPDLDTEVTTTDIDPSDDVSKPSVTEPVPIEENDNDQGIPVATAETAFPSSPPTVNPITQFKFDATLDLLVDRDVVSSAKKIEKNPDSPQYYATSWLSRDPDYFNYNEDRLIQRWTLAVLAYSLDLSSTAVPPSQRRRVQDEAGSDVLQGWLRYTDECTWFTSSTTGSPCNTDGMYTTIDIQDMMLGGTLPSELSLLANSLEHIILEGNELVGIIPKEFEELSNLATLRLRQNNIEGSVSIDVGKLLKLEILDLGNNTLTGGIPYSIVDLDFLTELHLDYNSISGQIPWEIGDLEATLTTLALSDNNLSGWVPDGLANLNNLQVLTLGNNKLSGDLPKDVCRFRDLEVLSVDCEAQGCECCTECASSPTIAPTGFPTISPTVNPTASFVRFTPMPVVTDTPSNAPSRSRTSFPTERPSDNPTECVNEIKLFDFCFEPSVDITVSLTNCEPDRDDWVGLYRMDDTFDSMDLTNPNIWSWACGTRNCREPAGSKIIPFNNNHAAQWPMKPGTYVAIIARNSAQPYTAYAVSDAFVIAETCLTK